MSQKFKRNIEDFACEKCGAEVRGDGFTNHCPKCLWSKHVDVNPGDRAALCGGLMEPAEVVFEAGEYSIIHKCVMCGYSKKNKVASDDDFDLVVAIAKRKADK